MWRVLPALLILLVPTPGTAIHDPPPIWLEMKLTGEELVIRVAVMVPLLDQWIPTERAEKLALSEEEAIAASKLIEERFAGLDFVHVDGVHVAPVLRDLKMTQVEDHFVTIDYFKFDLVIGTKGRPKKIRFFWKDFDIFPNWPLDGIAALFDYGDDEAYVEWTEEEPEYTWHAPLEKKERGPRITSTPAPKGVPVPILAVALAAGALVFLPLSFFFSLRGRTRLIAFVLLLGAAGATAGSFERRMELPWLTELSRPKPAEAVAIFESLHRNIYRAFDYDSEDEIYAALEQSVEGELLEEVYVEVYDSLILREEGGAMCRIKRVDLLEGDVKFAEETADEFTTFCRWRVHGRVGHFGHEHLRVNEYAADYTLRRRGDGWRISDVEIREQKRIEVEPESP